MSDPIDTLQEGRRPLPSTTTLSNQVDNDKKDLSRPVSPIANTTDDAATLAEGVSEPRHFEGEGHPLAKLGNVRKHVLLLVFTIASFVDVCNVSGLAVAVAKIGFDTKLETSQFVWIITSYSLMFSSFLLFAGRLSDIFPATWVFVIGFVGLGIFSLVTSFVTTNKYGFLILRGLGGIFGSLTIPSGYHLIVQMFVNPEEREKKLALLGVAGALGNVLGLVLAGLTMLASYHWFFRLMAIICLAFSGVALMLLPMNIGSHHDPSHGPRWKLLDIPGVVLMCGFMICFILSLTQGPIDGWGSASFIAPFIISFFLLFGFFAWETLIPPRSAVLPGKVWQIKNMKSGSLVVLVPFSFWATSQLLYSTYWQNVMHWAPIHVAAGALPQGIAALVVGGVVQAVPQIIGKPRITIPVSSALIIVSYILMYFSDGGRGTDYWRYVFPAFVLGSVGAISMFMASAINIINFAPPEMSGVSGAWTQVVAQVGGAVALAVQAGLEAPDLEWRRSARSFFFQIGIFAFVAVVYVVFYRQPGTKEEEHELTRQRIAASEKNKANKSEA